MRIVIDGDVSHSARLTETLSHASRTVTHTAPPEQPSFTFLSGASPCLFNTVYRRFLAQ